MGLSKGYETGGNHRYKGSCQRDGVIGKHPSPDRARRSADRRARDDPEPQLPSGIEQKASHDQSRHEGTTLSHKGLLRTTFATSFADLKITLFLWRIFPHTERENLIPRYSDDWRFRYRPYQSNSRSRYTSTKQRQGSILFIQPQEVQWIFLRNVGPPSSPRP